MRKPLLAIAVFLCALSAHAVSVTLTPAPRITFVNGSGGPCAGCTLTTYVAGTTTPLATYVDSLGISVNTNPIILDAAGGANIWIGRSSYKFILKTALGATIWSVDNVNAGSLLPCAPANTIQIANGSANGFSCDANITIDTVNHTLNVGTLSVNHVTIGALGTPTAWTFDTTTPATALASLGGVVLPAQAADSALMNATGGSAVPTAVVLPAGCAYGDNYDTATHAWTCVATAVPLTRLAVQAADTVVMNKTGGSAAPTAAVMPVGCTSGDNYDTSTHAWSCVSAGTTTCNANGCYNVSSNGYIHAWGISSVVAGTPVQTALTITYPTTFVTPPTPQTTAVADAVGGGSPCSAGACPVTCHVLKSSIGTTGATVGMGISVAVGGSGFATLAAGDYCSWTADGK